MYKAQNPTTDTQGAPDVKEDQHVKVEVPVDQVSGGPGTSLLCPPWTVLPASASSLPAFPQVLLLSRMSHGPPVSYCPAPGPGSGTSLSVPPGAHVRLCIHLRHYLAIVSAPGQLATGSSRKGWSALRQPSCPPALALAAACGSKGRKQTVSVSPQPLQAWGTH